MNAVRSSCSAFGLNRWDSSSPAAFARDVQRAEQLGWDYAFTREPVGALGSLCVAHMCGATHHAHRSRHTDRERRARSPGLRGEFDRHARCSVERSSAIGLWHRRHLGPLPRPGARDDQGDGASRTAGAGVDGRRRTSHVAYVRSNGRRRVRSSQPPPNTLDASSRPTKRKVFSARWPDVHPTFRGCSSRPLSLGLGMGWARPFVERSEDS